MSAVYLHIGTPKTGTTAIQEFLLLNRQQLSERGVCYPYCGRSKGSVRIDNAFWLLEQDPESDEAKKRIKKLGRLGISYPKIILTEETLWRAKAGDVSFWKKFKKALAREGLTLKIVVYLRRQDEVVYSLWEQRIKTNTNKDFRGTLHFEDYLKRQVYPSALLDYAAMLQPYESLLGIENLLVRTYEHSQFYEGNIFADFLDVLGLKPDDAFSIPEGQSNVSLKGNMLEAKRLLNMQEAFVQNYSLRGRLQKAQAAMIEDGTFCERTGFSYQQRMEYMKQFEAGNRFTAEHYLHRTDGILFYEQIKEPDEPSGDYTSEELAEAFGHLLMEVLDANQNLIQTKKKLNRRIRKLEKENTDLKSRKAFD